MESEKEFAQQLYEQYKGSSIDKVSRDNGISPTRFRTLMFKYGFFSYEKYNLDENFVRELVEKYGCGQASNKIKGVPRYVFNAFCADKNIGTRRHPLTGTTKNNLGKSPERVELYKEIARKMDEGVNFKLLEEEYGIGRRSLGAIRANYAKPFSPKTITDAEYDAEMQRILDEFGCLEQIVIQYGSKYSITGVKQHYGSLKELRLKFGLNEKIGEQQAFINYFTKVTGIELIQEYRLNFIDSSINSNYRFDGFNENLSLAVEYDDISHFEPIPRLGGEKGLKIRVERDFFKNEFCENHGIKLIRFKYSEAFKRDSILEKVHDIVELP